MPLKGRAFGRGEVVLMVLGGTLGAASAIEVLLFSLGQACGGIIFDLTVSAIFTLTFYRAHRDMWKSARRDRRGYRGGYKRAAILGVIAMAAMIPIFLGGVYVVLGFGIAISALTERKFLTGLGGLIIGIVGIVNNYYAPLLNGIQADIERPLFGLTVSVIILAIGYLQWRLLGEGPL